MNRVSYQSRNMHCPYRMIKPRMHCIGVNKTSQSELFYFSEALKDWRIDYFLFKVLSINEAVNRVSQLSLWHYAMSCGRGSRC